MTLFIGCEKSAAPAAPPASASTNTFNANRAQPRLPTTKLWLGAQELTAELAARPKEIMTGMMFRQTMEENEAMLFIFTSADRRSFWMKNVSLPLSCAYIDSDGVILEIHDLKPLEEKPVESASDKIQYVLETRQGWFERNRIAVGTLVRTEKGALRDTFFRRR